MPKTLALPEAVQQFLTYLTVEKGFAQGTCTSYRTKLKAFTIFVEEDLGHSSALDKITLSLLRRYLARRAPGKGAKARADEITHLQAFFNFLVREGLLNHNPAAVLVKPKQEKRLPVYLTVGECERLLATVDHYSRCPELEGTILRLLLYTGIRVGELVGPDHAGC